MNQVEWSFKDKGISRNGISLYSKSVAVEFINECKKQEIAILGIDALLLIDKFTQPSLENSIDFTASSFGSSEVVNIGESAIKFLNERNDKYHFEIVCSEGI